MLHEGPSLILQLVKVLMKFRCRKIVVTGDIEKAFLNVVISKAYRKFLNLLWMRDFNPYEESDSFNIETLRFTRCVFDVKSSPFHLQAT